MGKCRIAIIGCGAAARHKYLPALRGAGARPTCFIDNDEEAARDLARGSPVGVEADLPSVLSGIDAAIVTTPVRSRSRLCRDLLHAGKHVLVQPPLAVSAESVGAVLDTAQASNTLLVASSHFRFAAAARWIKSLVDDRALGPLVAFDVRDGRRFDVDAGNAIYWNREESCGGVLAEPGAHILDLLSWWLGRLSVANFVDDGYGGVEAEAMASLSTASGVAGTVELSRTRSLRNSAIIRGEQGWVELDLRRFSLRAGPDDLLDRTYQGVSGRSCADRNERRLFTAQLKAWRDAISGQRRTAHGESDALNTIATLEECYRRREQWVMPWVRASESEAPKAEKSVSPLRGRSVAITGATGFIGTRLAEKLVLQHGAKVTAVVRNYSRAARISRLDLQTKKANLDKYNEIEDAIDGADVVFNLAYDFSRTGDENVRAFVNLANACARRNVRCLVHVSSIVVYDDWPAGDISESSPAHNPGADYKNAKMQMEAELSRRAEDGSLASVVVQPTIVYGPFGWIWTDQFVEQLTTGTVVLPDGGQGLCPAVYVDDVADAMIAAATHTDKTSERFIISGPEPVTWRAFFETYAGILGVDSIQYIDVATLTDGSSGPLAKLKALVGNPLQIAGWWPIRKLLGAARERLGDDAIEKLRSAAMTLRRRRGPVVYYPNESQLALYLSKGRCRVEKASERLSFVPAFDFAAGAKPTADYIRWRFPEAVDKGRKT